MDYVFISYGRWGFLDLYANIVKRKEKEKMSIYMVYAVAAVASAIFAGFIYFSLRKN